LSKNDEPLVVSAVDLDINDNGRLIYKIIDEDEEITKKFFIDQFSGAISFKSTERKANNPPSQIYQFKVSRLTFFCKICLSRALILILEH